MWPFKRKRNINQLIFDYAEHRRSADTQELIACLMHTELFAPIASGAPNLPDGTRYVVSAADSIQVFSVQLGDLRCIAFYTDRSDDRLRGACLSMTGAEAMRMVLKTDADGIVIQN